jgi:hypothetical protein
VSARTTVLAAAVVTVVALLAGCGSDADGGPAATDQVTTVVQPSIGGRACAMTSIEEVGNAIGALPVASIEHDAAGVLACSFIDGAKTEMASIAILTVESDPSPAVAFARLTASEGDGNELIDGEVVTFTILPQETLENSEAVRSATLDLATLALPRFAPAAP